MPHLRGPLRTGLYCGVASLRDSGFLQPLCGRRELRELSLQGEGEGKGEGEGEREKEMCTYTHFSCTLPIHVNV